MRGIIKDVRGAGGMLSILFEDPETGKTRLVHCDNGPTVRALVSLFGNEILSGPSLVVDRIQGLEVSYDVDSIGVLAWIGE